MRTLSDHCLNAVWNALTPDGPGSTPASVHADVHVGGWALVTVRHALRQLVELGRARRSGPETQMRYWRVEP